MPLCLTPKQKCLERKKRAAGSIEVCQKKEAPSQNVEGSKEADIEEVAAERFLLELSM